MNWPDIERRIEAGEDEQTEFKRGLEDLKPVGRAVCAFANTAGGTVILGVSDSQKIVGVAEDAERVLERLSAFLQSGCSSPVAARVEHHQHPLGWVLWIEVPSQRGFEPLRLDGKVWIRRHRATVEPEPKELQELYNVFGYVLTEAQTIQAGTASHIDLRMFREFLEKQGLETEGEPQPPVEGDLRNRGLLRELGGSPHATLYGSMCYGKEPQIYPQTRSFFIQCAAYQGADQASTVLQVADAAGRLDEQVRRALGWFAGLGRYESYQDLVRKDTPLLPAAALREALVNAVVHRDYAKTGAKIMFEVFERHVDVTSPGGLPYHMNVESVQAGGNPRSRNESMVFFMQVMGFMERRGRGWPVMRKAMREFNGTEPEMMQAPGSDYVRVRFRLAAGD